MENNNENQDDRTPLHRASSNGQIALVRKLIQQDGHEIDCRDEMEWTPLIIAASAGHKDIVEYLCEKGANINAQTINGQTSLHYCSSKGWLDICKYLIDSGANLNVCDRLKQTPLHRACSRNNVDIVRYFLTLKNINVNIKDIVGNTPLHLACEEENEDVIKLLIQSDANIDIRNDDKKTPFDLCRDYKFQKSLRNYCSKN